MPDSVRCPNCGHFVEYVYTRPDGELMFRCSGCEIEKIDGSGGYQKKLTEVTHGA